MATQEGLKRDIAERTAQLQQLSVKLMNVQDDERRRLVRELHDRAGQYLAGIHMNLGALLRADLKEIDDKTFGRGFDCIATDAVCNLGVADWHGLEQIRENLRAFIDKGLTAHHDVIEYWDSPSLKIFRGIVTMKFDDPGVKTIKPVMTHFFYMNKAAPSKVSHWIGSVGPTVL